MSSRKGQREEARARRLAEEQARAERARRQRNLRMLGGVLIAAVAVVAVAIAISSGGGSKAKGLAQGKAATQNSTAVSQLLGGIPQTGARLGNPKAPVTMYYYGDLQCPICQQFTLQGGFPQLVANEVRSGKVQIVYRGLQTATRDAPTFQTEQVAALAAGKQNRFWNYAELFYREQGAEGSGYANENYLTGLAKQIPGLNLTEWQSARNDSGLASQVQSDASLATSSGFNATPTLVVQGPRGKTEPASTDYTDIQQAVKSVS
ncbi:MAG: DsbA family protein [Solirubrobacteraceae bacterium]